MPMPSFEETWVEPSWGVGVIGVAVGLGEGVAVGSEVGVAEGRRVGVTMGELRPFSVGTWVEVGDVAVLAQAERSMDTLNRQAPINLVLFDIPSSSKTRKANHPQEIGPGA
jgi:hypothetical protein